MSLIQFNFTLSDEQAETFVDIIDDRIETTRSIGTHGHWKTTQELEWCKAHAAYLVSIKDIILKGQTRL